MASSSGLLNSVPMQPSDWMAVPSAGMPPPPVPADPSRYTAAQANPTSATATGYNPNAYAVTNDQTVQGQLKKVVAEDSPLMQQATTRANQEMNRRGLLSSSLAVGAGQDAVIAQALPIATSDAATYERAGTNTVNAQNAALNFGAAAQNQASQTNAQLGTNVNLANAEGMNAANREAATAGNQLKLANLDTQTKAWLASLDTNTRLAVTNLDNATKISLGQMDNQYKQLLQTNSDAASMFNQVTQAIAQISQNASMSPEAKDAAIASQLNNLNEALKQQAYVTGTPNEQLRELDLSQYFNSQYFKPVPQLPPPPVPTPWWTPTPVE